MNRLKLVIALLTLIAGGCGQQSPQERSRDVPLAQADQLPSPTPTTPQKAQETLKEPTKPLPSAFTQDGKGLEKPKPTTPARYGTLGTNPKKTPKEPIKPLPPALAEDKPKDDGIYSPGNLWNAGSSGSGLIGRTVSVRGDVSEFGGNRLVLEGLIDCTFAEKLKPVGGVVVVRGVVAKLDSPAAGKVMSVRDAFRNAQNQANSPLPKLYLIECDLVK